MIQHITEVREFAGDDTEIKSLVDEGSFGEGQGSSMPPSAVNSVLEQINLVLLNVATSCVLLGYLNSTQFFGFQGTFCASMESGSGRDYMLEASYTEKFWIALVSILLKPWFGHFHN